MPSIYSVDMTRNTNRLRILNKLTYIVTIISPPHPLIFFFKFVHADLCAETDV